jgi:8-oxo-dGTP diphosphatase
MTILPKPERAPKVVTAAVLRRGTQVLIVRRGSASSLAGFWEFPGGKIEPDETAEQCLARELQEELGIEAEIGKLLCESHYVYEHGSFLIMAFEVPRWTGDLNLTVHDQAEWIETTNLLGFSLLPADVPIAKRIMKE